MRVTSTVPNVVNQTQDAASTAITGAGARCRTVTKQTSGSVAAGAVISQNPAAGQSRSPGTAVALLISLGANGVSMPDLVGLSEAAALSVINAAGLVAGPIRRVPVPSATGVIAQTPLPNVIVTSGSTVYLQVSTSGASSTVPNVVGLTQAAASSAINAAGLIVGTVTSQTSASVPAGSVISQNPLAGATVASGSAVDLVVSTGPAPVLVPNVVGLTLAAANIAISGANLVGGAVTTQPSATVPVGIVISQTPLAGSSVAPGSAVNVILSSGPAPGLVYKPIEPCRIMDTRSATAGSGVQGPISGKRCMASRLHHSRPELGPIRRRRRLRLRPDQSAGRIDPRGGARGNDPQSEFRCLSGHQRCQQPQHGVVERGVEFHHGQGLSTMYIVPQIATQQHLLRHARRLSAHLIFDVVGYHVVAERPRCNARRRPPRRCRSRVQRNRQCYFTRLHAGYTLTAGSCDSTSATMSLAQDKAASGNTAWFCSAINRGASPANLTATATCCRVPGK